MINYLRSNLFSSGLRGYLVRGTFGTFCLLIVSTGFGFATNILLARYLGGIEYGVYTYIFSWVGLLVTLSMFGMGNVLIKEVSAFQVKDKWERLRGIFQWAISWGLIVSTTVVIAAMSVVWFMQEDLAPEIFPAIWVALIITPFVAATNLIAAALQGLKRVVLSKIPSVLVRAPILLVLIVCVNKFYPQSLSAFTFVIVTGFAVGIDIIVACWCLYKVMPKDVFRSPAEYLNKKWLHSAFPLLLMMGLFELNTRIPCLMLGSLADIKTVGVYNIASLISGFVSFIMIAVNIALGPVISSLYVSGEMKRLQRIVTLSARMMFLVSCLMAFFLAVFHHGLLNLFGPEFQDAGPILLILLFGQVINVAAGSVGTLLLMTGHEKDVVVSVGVSTILVFILNVVFIPMWGGMGAAYSAVAGLILWNILLVYQAASKLGLDSTALGVLIHTKEN